MPIALVLSVALNGCQPKELTAEQRLKVTQEQKDEAQSELNQATEGVKEDMLRYNSREYGRGTETLAKRLYHARVKIESNLKKAQPTGNLHGFLQDHKQLQRKQDTFLNNICDPLTSKLTSDKKPDQLCELNSNKIVIGQIPNAYLERHITELEALITRREAQLRKEKALQTFGEKN